MRYIIIAIYLVLGCDFVSAAPNSANLNRHPIYWDFGSAKSLPAWITYTRAACTSSQSCATDGLITDAAGFSYNAYAANIPIFYNGQGLEPGNSRNQYLLNSAVPVTQTTGSLGTGTYQFWCIGSGSEMSSAGTATASGLGALTCLPEARNR